MIWNPSWHVLLGTLVLKLCPERTISASNSLRFNVTQSVSWEQRAWKSGNQVNNVIMAEHTNEWSKLYLALFIWSFSTVNILIQVINLRIKYWILCQNAVSSENFLTLPTLRPEYDMHQLHYHTLHLRNCLLHLKSKDYFPIVMWESKRISSMYRLCSNHLLQVSSVNTQIYCHAVTTVTPRSRSLCFVFSIRYCYLHAISVKETNQQNTVKIVSNILKN